MTSDIHCPECGELCPRDSDGIPRHDCPVKGDAGSVMPRVVSSDSQRTIRLPDGEFVRLNCKGVQLRICVRDMCRREAATILTKRDVERLKESIERWLATENLGIGATDA